MIAVFIPAVFWAALFYPCGQQNARFGLELSLAAHGCAWARSGTLLVQASLLTTRMFAVAQFVNDPSRRLIAANRHSRIRPTR